VAGLEVHGEDGLLRSVAVEAEYRGLGLAASLVEARTGAGEAPPAPRRVPPHDHGPRVLRAAWLRRLPARGCAAAIRESWEFPHRLPLDGGVHEAHGRLRIDGPDGPAPPTGGCP